MEAKIKFVSVETIDGEEDTHTLDTTDKWWTGDRVLVVKVGGVFYNYPYESIRVWFVDHRPNNQDSNNQTEIKGLSNQTETR